MEQLNKIAEETSVLLPIQRDFYKIMLLERKEKILDSSTEQLLKQEQQASKQQARS